MRECDLPWKVTELARILGQGDNTVAKLACQTKVSLGPRLLGPSDMACCCDSTFVFLGCKELLPFKALHWSREVQGFKLDFLYGRNLTLMTPPIPKKGKKHRTLCEDGCANSSGRWHRCAWLCLGVEQQKQPSQGHHGSDHHTHSKQDLQTLGDIDGHGAI